MPGSQDIQNVKVEGKNIAKTLGPTDYFAFAHLHGTPRKELISPRWAPGEYSQGMPP